MYIQTVVWTRPNKDVQWSWIGIPEIDSYEAVMATVPGLLHRSATNTDTTYTLVSFWEDQASWQAHSLLPETLALVAAQAQIMTDRGITKTITSETTP
jgi:quinol monooxygenase YgiN